VTRALLVLPLALISCGHKVTNETTAPWFQDVAPASGINFIHKPGATGQFYMPEIMGSGAALLDYDGDGDLDVLLLQSGHGSRLYRNELIPTGKLRFTDVTRESGFDYAGYGMGIATGDFDNDGRIDVLVTGYGGNALYRNLGGGVFRNVTAESPDIILAGKWSTGAAFFDYDRDGRQDLIIVNYLDYSMANNKRCYAPTGELTYCTPKVYPPASAHLFHNEGGRFVDVTKQSGMNRALGRGLGVAVFDANGDGWPDVFVANDASANHLWINQRDGTFVERGLQSGVAYGEEGVEKAGMGVAVGDYNNDGHEDLLVLNLMREGATLFNNDGHGSFADVSLKTGIHAITFPYTGFGAGWIDFDNDGWLDLFLANGAVTLREEQRGQPYPFLERNLLIRNDGRGRFIDESDRAGAVFTQRGVSRGAAFGDIDNDGSMDILVSTNNGPARILRNNLPHRNWLNVQIDGPGLGIGARVAVKAGGLPELWRRVHTDSSYLSASDARVHFGLGDATHIERVTVYWPDGSQSTYADVAGKLNSVFHVRQKGR
jgi:enediyne biosynthesis protein E4